jgi:hypothetical protein
MTQKTALGDLEDQFPFLCIGFSSASVHPLHRNYSKNRSDYRLGSARSASNTGSPSTTGNRRPHALQSTLPLPSVRPPWQTGQTRNASRSTVRRAGGPGSETAVAREADARAVEEEGAEFEAEVEEDIPRS